MPVLLYSPKMKALATAVAARDSRHIELGGIRWKQFGDTFPDILIKNVDGLRHRDVSYLSCMDTPDGVFAEVSTVLTLAALGPKSLRILLPYFPTGTMERSDDEGQVATAHTLAQMISCVAPAGLGPVPLYVWDLHTLQNMKYFGSNIAPRGKWGIRVLQKRLEGRDVSIAFPDEGAWKRFKLAFSGKDGKPLCPFVLCSKTRLGEQRIVRILEGDVHGRDTVIVDDLIHSGGTLIECAKVLKDTGANSVSAYATHGVMENEAWRKFLDAGFDKVWITDTCPDTAAAVAGQGPFEVLSIADSVHEAVMDGLRQDRTRDILLSFVEIMAAHLPSEAFKNRVAPILERLREAA